MTTTLEPETEFKPSPEPCRETHPDGHLQCDREHGHTGSHQHTTSGDAESDSCDVVTKWFDEGVAVCGDESEIANVVCGRPPGHPGSHVGGNFIWSEAGEMEEDEERAGELLKTTVNGEEANVVMDGTTGGVKGAQLRLLPADPNEIMKRLRETSFELDREEIELELRHSSYKEQKQKVDKVQLALNRIVVELREATKDEPIAPVIADVTVDEVTQETLEATPVEQPDENARASDEVVPEPAEDSEAPQTPPVPEAPED